MSRTRFARLADVFRNGTSPLLNALARLSVLYEDLRIEYNALIAEAAAEPNEYRVMYYVRRSLTTLVEFQSALTQVVMTNEYKNASITAKDHEYITAANKYFQEHAPTLKELRNEFGGHVQRRSTDFATTNFPSNYVGKITWGKDEILRLELDFAADIIAGAMTSKLQQGTDVRDELRRALTIVISAYTHVQGATYALTHAFLWERFGK